MIRLKVLKIFWLYILHSICLPRCFFVVLSLWFLCFLWACLSKADVETITFIDSHGFHFNTDQQIPVNFSDTQQTLILFLPFLHDKSLPEISSLDGLDQLEKGVFYEFYYPEFVQPGSKLATEIKSKIPFIKKYVSGEESLLMDDLILRKEKKTALVLTTPSGVDRFLKKWQTEEVITESYVMTLFVLKPDVGVQIMKLPFDPYLWGKSIIFGTIAEEQ